MSASSLGMALRLWVCALDPDTASSIDAVSRAICELRPEVYHDLLTSVLKVGIDRVDACGQREEWESELIQKLAAMPSLPPPEPVKFDENATPVWRDIEYLSEVDDGLSEALLAMHTREAAGEAMPTPAIAEGIIASCAAMLGPDPDRRTMMIVINLALNLATALQRLAHE
jgi:hypothetical protein